MPTPPGTDHAELRRVGAQIHDHVESAAIAFAESRAAIAGAGKNWTGKSGQALRKMVARLAEQDRELLARERDLAHHMIRTSDDDDVVG